ncbi:hypothetical protein GWK47_050016 [Chionoecetes opilio]|uniref:Uncharacterized protein n=1 Tax=Chionoecetes opilio TaxID=41210 RepID=A0A8J4Y9G4_CHIOP|nr:hypothetical protein GWK47_050016 [Chionoecetes opilio]
MSQPSVQSLHHTVKHSSGSAGLRQYRPHSLWTCYSHSREPRGGLSPQSGGRHSSSSLQGQAITRCPGAMSLMAGWPPRPTPAASSREVWPAAGNQLGELCLSQPVSRPRSRPGRRGGSPPRVLRAGKIDSG